MSKIGEKAKTIMIVFIKIALERSYKSIFVVDSTKSKHEIC